MLAPIIKKIKHWFVQSTYSSDLERFIISRNPKDSFDVEQLEREFNIKLAQGKLI